jgi:hypothetical protein
MVFFTVVLGYLRSVNPFRSMIIRLCTPSVLLLYNYVYSIYIYVYIYISVYHSQSVAVYIPKDNFMFFEVKAAFLESLSSSRHFPPSV